MLSFLPLKYRTSFMGTITFFRQLRSSKIVDCIFTFDIEMSNVLKLQVIKKVFNYSGCMFTTECIDFLHVSFSLK